MYRSAKEIVEIIKRRTGLDEKIIWDKIKKKRAEYNYSISDVAAARLVAKELGVELEQKLEGRVKIKDLRVGLKGIYIEGKILDKSEIKRYRSKNKSGLYAYMFVADETGKIKLMLWDEDAYLVNKFNVGDTIRALVEIREGRFGPVAVLINGKIEKIEKEIEVKAKEEKIPVKLICELKDNEKVIVKGTILYNLSDVYIIDDGTGEIRVKKIPGKEFNVGDFIYAKGIYSRGILIPENIDVVDLRKEINYLLLKCKKEENAG